MAEWRLMQGDVLLGELSEYGCDQPFFLARFSPGPGWESAEGLFGALTTLSGPDPDGSQAARVMTPLRDLELTLVPTGGQQPSLGVFRNCVLRIDGDTARLRY
ncbi:hypothetical protein [Kitasatospora mediocidica]|uniref:hypothetical protein n=1 Tax=Kitasatospora mediocidica TaxID=58352 RepID=UPI000A9877CA|nr:hypothetical protein [Kitasatospora mediocidica]